MTREEAESELMQIYGMLSEEKKQALDVLMAQADKAENTEDKVIRQTLENFMRGLWEEIQVGELEYTTSEVYEMLEREIFTDNHVAIPNNVGHWIILDECSNSGYYCSECHKKVVKEGWSATVKKIKFCPNCGAKMD